MPFNQLHRRKFVTLLGGAAATWPLTARAQQRERMRRIGVLLPATADDSRFQTFLGAFLQAEALLGWAIGRNVQIDTRWATANVAEIRRHAAELVALAPDVILAHGDSTVGPLLQTTRTVPVVFPVVTDPVGAGYVDSLARPGGNATGFTQFEYGVGAKSLELLKEISPGVVRAVVLRDPTSPDGVGQFAAIQAVGPSLGVELRPIGVRDPDEIERAVTTIARGPGSGLIVTASGLAILHRERIIALAARHRREFIALLGGAVAWPLAARAQQPGRTYRLGFFLPVARDAPAIIAFFDELRVHGFVEGQNLAIIPGGFQAGNNQIDDLVPALIKAAPDAIIAGGDVIPRALQNATRTIPIVVITEDMVAAGFAASLARPGGNITGISLMSPDLDGKRQDILIEAVPGTRRIAALADSNVATLRHLQALEEAARAHGKELLVVRAAKAEELVPAMNDVSTRGAGALNVLSSPMLFLNRRVIIERAAELRLPSVYQWPEMAEEGGLLGYGPRFVDVFRQRAGRSAGRAAHHVRASNQSQDR